MGRPNRGRRRRSSGMNTFVSMASMAAAVGHPPPGEQMLPRHPAPATDISSGAMMLPADHPPGEQMPPRRRYLQLPFGWMAEPSAERTQASSSDHPGAERTGTGTRVRQSVLYSDRPRRPRRRRATEHVEHPNEGSSIELGVTNPRRFQTLVSDTELDIPMETPSATGSARFHPDHPGAERAVYGPRIRQSVLYSNRPRRPRRRQVPLSTEEHPSEVSSSEPGGAVTDLPTLESLSLMNELPLFIPVETSEDSDDDPPVLTPRTPELSDSELSDSNDDNDPHEPIEFGIGSFEAETLCYSAPRPRFKWVGGVIGGRRQTPEEPAVAGTSSKSGSPKSTETNPIKDSNDDWEALSRRLSKYRAERDARLELAAKRITEPPRSLQIPRKPRCEASNAELAENAENWMREEVKIVFEKYMERREDLKGLNCCFDELRHQCFNVEHYHKIYHHYNFTVRMKEEPNSVDWVVAMYFAEVKQIFGRKYYSCCRLYPHENGHCYACKSQGVEDLRHPVTGGFESGLPNVRFGLWYDE